MDNIEYYGGRGGRGSRNPRGGSWQQGGQGRSHYQDLDYQGGGNVAPPRGGYRDRGGGYQGGGWSQGRGQGDYNGFEQGGGYRGSRDNRGRGRFNNWGGGRAGVGAPFMCFSTPLSPTRSRSRPSKNTIKRTSQAACASLHGFGTEHLCLIWCMMPTAGPRGPGPGGQPRSNTWERERHARDEETLPADIAALTELAGHTNVSCSVVAQQTLWRFHL